LPCIFNIIWKSGAFLLAAIERGRSTVQMVVQTTAFQGQVYLFHVLANRNLQIAGYLDLDYL